MNSLRFIWVRSALLVFAVLLQPRFVQAQVDGEVVTVSKKSRGVCEIKFERNVALKAGDFVSVFRQFGKAASSRNYLGEAKVLQAKNDRAVARCLGFQPRTGYAARTSKRAAKIDSPNTGPRVVRLGASSLTRSRAKLKKNNGLETSPDGVREDIKQRRIWTDQDNRKLLASLVYWSPDALLLHDAKGDEIVIFMSDLSAFDKTWLGERDPILRAALAKQASEESARPKEKRVAEEGNAPEGNAPEGNAPEGNAPEGNGRQPRNERKPVAQRTSPGEQAVNSLEALGRWWNDQHGDPEYPTALSLFLQYRDVKRLDEARKIALQAGNKSEAAELERRAEKLADEFIRDSGKVVKETVLETIREEFGDPNAPETEYDRKTATMREIYKRLQK